MYYRAAHAKLLVVDEHFLPDQHKSFNPNDGGKPGASDLSKPNISLLTPTSANDTGSPNPLTNMDGFGVGWWSDTFEQYDSGVVGKDGLRPTVYKNVRPPLNDLVLKSLARGIQTKAVVAHIRAGTGNLPFFMKNPRLVLINFY